MQYLLLAMDFTINIFSSVIQIGFFDPVQTFLTTYVSTMKKKEFKTQELLIPNYLIPSIEE